MSVFRKLIANAISEKEFITRAEKIIDEKTKRVADKLRGKKVDWFASVEVVQKQAYKILSKDAKDFEWAKEKSIIVIKQ